jgi:hypothetical protein
MNLQKQQMEGERERLASRYVNTYNMYAIKASIIKHSVMERGAEMNPY